MGKKTVVFFIRAYNDLDHFAPILYKLLSTDKYHAIAILTTTNINCNDYRLKFLKPLSGFELITIDSFHDSKFKNLFKLDGKPQKLFKYIKQEFNKILDFLKIYPYCPNAPEIASELIIPKLILFLSEISPKPVCCIDHNADDFTAELTRQIKQADIISIALPHGDLNYYSTLGGPDINYDCQMDVKIKMVNLFDYFVLPNELMYERQQYSKINVKNKIEILGSPRFNEEWVNIHKGILPELQLKKAKMNICLLMRFIGWPLHFEELLTSVKIISNFSDVHLAIKFHTRMSGLAKLKPEFKHRFPGFVKKLDNVTIHGDETPTTSLILWSDLVIELGTSAAFEAVVLDKNILALEYLHPDLTTIAHFFPMSVLRSRDDLHHEIQKSLIDKSYRTYDADDRKSFINQMIHTPDRFVLKRYVEFIDSQIPRHD